MLVGNAKPLMIVWLPITSAIFGDLATSDWLTKLGSSWQNNVVDFIIRRTKETATPLGEIPIPFYFYERMLDTKDAPVATTGFLLDSVSESINLSYPETPTADTNGSTKARVFTIRNTLNVNYRVKMDSTLVSVMRALLKRVLTNKEIAQNIRFSFFWNEYVMAYCHLVDYDEEPITGTDLTMLKFTFDSFQWQVDGVTEDTGDGSDVLDKTSFGVP